MKYILIAGLALGVSCGVWALVMGYTGWYKDPAMSEMFWVILLLEVVALAWGMHGTAGQGRTFGPQLAAGTLISMLGGLIVVGFSLLFTTVLFPDYFRDLAAVNEHMLRAAGKNETEIQAGMNAYWRTATPQVNALIGFCGTLLTGVLASIVIAAFVRFRPAYVMELPPTPAPPARRPE